ncbi:hypothetical protein AAC387_Pa04g1820 [Persea americana]
MLGQPHPICSCLVKSEHSEMRCTPFLLFLCAHCHPLGSADLVFFSTVVPQPAILKDSQHRSASHHNGTWE